MPQVNEFSWLNILILVMFFMFLSIFKIFFLHLNFKKCSNIFNLLHFNIMI